MKKQASDQYSHDRRYQERKRTEAAKQSAKKKVLAENASKPVVPSSGTKESSKI